jgi:hypothetical protein
MPLTTEDPVPAGDSQNIVRISSPTALLALVPQLMGFEPHLSIVLLGMQPPRGQVGLTVRFDLPKTPNGPAQADEVARHAVSVLVAQGFQTGVAAGYGPGQLVTPVADALRRHAAELGFRLSEVLRAEGGRFWSYLCTEPACCPAEGVPYDVARDPVTSAFAAAGAPPVLASRDQFAAQVAALDGPQGEAMVQATYDATERSRRLFAQAASSGRGSEARRLVASAGLDAVREAINAYRAGGEFSSDADAAWLSVLLRDLRVRDDAWSRMHPEYRDAHLRLWTDLTRRARPGFVSPAASLLAFVAWQCGNGALANVALDRAQADDPDYSMAQLLREVIDSGASPRMARLPMTPEEVAASYADDENGPAEDSHDEPADSDDDLDGDEDGDPAAEGCADGVSPQL